jgi:hypothetical protein
MQTRGSEGGRRGFTGTSMQNFRWQIPHTFSARLTHGLKLDTGVWLLRCSVSRGTPMASAKNIQFQKAKVLRIEKFERAVRQRNFHRKKAMGRFGVFLPQDLPLPCSVRIDRSPAPVGLFEKDLSVPGRRKTMGPGISMCRRKLSGVLTIRCLSLLRNCPQPVCASQSSALIHCPESV